MKKDGLHLTDEYAEIMAEQITEASNRREQLTANRNLRITIKNDSNRSAKDNLEDTTQLTTTKQIAAKITGKGGDRIRKIKSLYNVEIGTTETDEDHRTFSIKGARKDTTKVHRILQEIAIDTEEQDKEQQATETYTNAPPKRTTKIPVICRFYLEGKCTRGNNCNVIHEAGPADITISTEHSTTSEDEEPSPEPSPVRKITSKDTKASKSRDDPPAHHKRKQRIPHKPRANTNTDAGKTHQKKPVPAEDMTPHQHHRIRDTTDTIGRRIGKRKAATAADTDPHQEQKDHQRETHPAVAKADEHPRHTPANTAKTGSHPRGRDPGKTTPEKNPVIGTTDEPPPHTDRTNTLERNHVIDMIEELHPPTDQTNTAPEDTDHPQTGVKGHPPLTEADCTAQTGAGVDHTARTEKLQGTNTNPEATMKKTLNGQSATS